jgi:hypothetical protein
LFALFGYDKLILSNVFHVSARFQETVEERYLITTLEDKIGNKVKEESLTASSISKALNSAGSNFHPRAVFVPLACG